MITSIYMYVVPTYQQVLSFLYDDELKIFFKEKLFQDHRAYLYRSIFPYWIFIESLVQKY